MQIHVDIQMDVKRCHSCGRHWAIEQGLGGRCPRCATNEIDKLTCRLTKLERSNNALRGALKRKARRAAT